jgi:hypothetical protein
MLVRGSDFMAKLAASIHLGLYLRNRPCGYFWAKNVQNQAILKGKEGSNLKKIREIVKLIALYAQFSKAALHS